MLTALYTNELTESNIILFCITNILKIQNISQYEIKALVTVAKKYQVHCPSAECLLQVL